MNSSSENLRQSGASLLKKLKEIHGTFRIYGSSPADLLILPDDLLLYLLSILKNDSSITAPVLDNKGWDDFIDFLNRQSITPLIYQSLRQMPLNSKPPIEILEKMKNVYFGGVYRSVKMEQVLKKVLDVANNNNIPILVLKGQATARTIYADPALRVSSDIDFIVSPKDLVTMRNILETIGCTSSEQTIREFDRQCGGYNEEVFYINNYPGIPIEIHWKLFPYYQLNRYIDLETMFQRAITVEQEYIAFKTLDYIDSLIYTSMHMMYGHNKEIELKWIIDISLLAKKLSSSDDWKELQRRCVQQRVVLPVEKSLLMAQLWTDFRIPAEFENFSKWPAPSKEDEKNLSLALNDKTWDQFRLMFPNDASFMEKVRILYHSAFPEPVLLLGTDSPYKRIYLPILYIKRWWKLFMGLFL